MVFISSLLFDFVIVVYMSGDVCFLQVNNYIVRPYRDCIVVANIVTRRTSKA